MSHLLLDYSSHKPIGFMVAIVDIHKVRKLKPNKEAPVLVQISDQLTPEEMVRVLSDIQAWAKQVEHSFLNERLGPQSTRNRVR